MWEAVCELEASESETPFSATKDSIRDTVIRIADIALKEGFDHQNGCMEDSLRSDGKGNKIRNRNRVWWVQAETVVGFINAYEKSDCKDVKYLDAARNVLDFIFEYLVDKRNGSEWFWEVNKDGTPIPGHPIVEPWKCPYHNGRMCIEIIKRQVYLDQ